MSNRKSYIGRIIGIFLLILFASGYHLSAYAEDLKGRIGVGFKAGFSKLTQDFYDDGTVGKIGPIIGGNMLYHFDNVMAAGFDLEWEIHSKKFNAFDFGDFHTLSLIPFLQIRYPKLNAFSPYGKIGLGINKNWDAYPYTVASKIAGGFDYFFNSNIALNSEIGWKRNSGNEKISCGCSRFSGDFNASVFTMLFGIRYYF